FGRDIFLLLAACTIICECWLGEDIDSYLGTILLVISVFFGLGWVLLTILSPGFLSEWKAVAVCSVLLLAGLSCYLLLPVFSMANPPMNWSYPRTLEGFFHALNRGQYERIHPTGSLARFIMQLGVFGKIAVNKYGLGHVLAAMVPLCFIR